MKAFLDDPMQHHRWGFAIPNWKFGIGFCGLFTLFSWLYKFSSTVALLQTLVRAVQDRAIRINLPSRTI